MKRRNLIFIFLLFAVICAAVLFPAEANAAEMEYTGKLNSYTGLPVLTMNKENSLQRSELGEELLYDHDTRLFLYGSGDTHIESNVVSDMITTSPVSISIPNGVVTVLYRDGEPVTEEDLGNITRPGKYVLCMGEFVKGDSALRFTITKKRTGTIHEYVMPSGFRVSSVVYNGVETEVEDASRVSLEQEGAYEIRYKCIKSQVNYSLNLIIDHTAPTLKLSNVINGRSDGAVDISDYNKDDTIKILRNKEEIKYTNTLTDYGSYVIFLEDEAGNSNSYAFSIPVYFNMSGIVFFLLILLTIAGLIIYPIYSRKHLRIR